MPDPSGVATLAIRWSEYEARKPYARPFAVSFHDESGASLGGIAASGHDLLYYRQFQAAVLALAGELFREPRVETAVDQQRAWLDLLAGLLPAAPAVVLIPQSEFHSQQGRVFHFDLDWESCPWARFEAPSLLEYQEFQAALAHQTGHLYRRADIEELGDPRARQLAWTEGLGGLLRRPVAAEAMASSWPWR